MCYYLGGVSNRGKGLFVSQCQVFLNPRPDTQSCSCRSWAIRGNRCPGAPYVRSFSNADAFGVESKSWETVCWFLLCGFPSCYFQHLKIVHTYSVFFPGPLDSSCYFTGRRFSLCWHRGYRYDRCRIQAEVASKHRHQCWLASPFARPGQGCWRKMTYCKCKTNFRCPYAINLQRIP